MLIDDGLDESGHVITHIEVGDRSTAIFLESRLYNAASQQVWAGPGNTMDAEYAAALFENSTGLSGSTSTRSQYDAAGRLISQRVETSTNRDNFWTLYYDAPDAYDGAGNVKRYVQAAGDTTSTIINHVTAVDGYKQWAVYTDSRSNSSGNETEGILVNVYDTNGYLGRVNDNSNGGGDSRSFVNDVYGHVLQKTQQGHVVRQLVVNGNVIGTYGVGVDAVNPKNPDRTPNFSDQTDFDLGNRPISASFPNAAAGPYSVQAGDTLRGIALAVYGDAELWYQIAAANGLRGDQDLRVGQTINIPTQVGSHNNASTFTPYNPGKITGSTSPNLPTPVGNGDDGCGTLGTVIMVAVAIAVTVVTQGAAGGFAGALLGAAAGSVASQAVGIAIGAQDKFSWNAVGDAVLVAGITYGLAPGADAASSGWQAAAARAAVANVATQGIKVAVGSQDHFEWKRVAASAVGAGVGGYLNSTGAFAEYGQYGGAFARAGVAGLATAAAGGGKIEVERIAADAFGNTLGQAFGEEVLFGGSNQSAAETARLGRDEASAAAQEAQATSAARAKRDALYGLASAAGRVRLGVDLGNSSSSITSAQQRALEAGRGPMSASAAQAMFDYGDWQMANTDLRMNWQPGQAGGGRGFVHPPMAGAIGAPSTAAPNDTNFSGGYFDDDRAGSGPAFVEPGAGFSSTRAAKLGRVVANDPIGEVLSADGGVWNWGVSTLEGGFKGAGLAQAASPEMSLAAALFPRVAADQQSMLRNIDSIRLPRVSYMSDDGLGPFTEGAVDFGLLGYGAFSLFRTTGAFSSLNRLPNQTYVAAEGATIGNLGNAGRTTADYLSEFSSTELNALRTAGLSDSEIARHVELNGGVNLFRGTSSGWAGSPGAQATAVSASTDPYIATVFALEARGQGGQAVLQFGTKADVGTFDVGNWMAAQEREVGVLTTASDFSARAPNTVSVDAARKVFGDMGMPNLPYSVPSPSARSTLLDAAPKMTPEQVAEFLQRIKMGSR